MEVKLLSITGGALDNIEFAARKCYDSQDKKKEGSAGKLIRACINKAHYSIIEHASASFEVTGVSRALLAQLTRHRLLSFSVRSQRYVKESEPNFVMPEGYNDKLQEIFESAMFDAWENYNDLISMGMHKEDARGVLPNACATELVITGNFRVWYDVLSVRLDRHAQKEIRGLANKIADILIEECPEVFEGLKQ